MNTVPKEFEDKFFFHFTHIENIPNIIKNGLLSTNLKTSHGVEHLDIACKEIQNTRHATKIPNCSLNSTIHDYVPFYFCSRTPMLLSLLHTKNIDQKFMIHICVSIKKLEQQNNIFTDESANREELPNFYNQTKDLKHLNWDIIESKSWKKGDDDYKHKRMAEALIYEKLDIKDIDYFVVWNESIKEMLEKEFKSQNKPCPPIKLDNENYYRHWYTGYPIGLPNITLISGPEQKYSEFNIIYKKVLEDRKDSCTYNFTNVEHLLTKLDSNFNIIKELNDISNLRTDNQEHSENVDSHTLTVIKNLSNVNHFTQLPPSQQNILKIAAYFHDIGKGPKSRWNECNGGIQKVDHDHPRRSMNMLQRILIEEIQILSDNDIRQILLLVGFHDFLGDYLVKGRKIDEILNFLQTQEDLDNLFYLSIADVLSIKPQEWYYNKQNEWTMLYNTLKEEMSL